QFSTIHPAHESQLTSHESLLLRYSLRMHDLGYFREHLDEFVQMAVNRGTVIDFDRFCALDRERRERITAAERLKAERNKASEKIARRKKTGEDASALLAEMKQVSNEIKWADEQI